MIYRSLKVEFDELFVCRKHQLNHDNYIGIWLRTSTVFFLCGHVTLDPLNDDLCFRHRQGVGVDP